MGNTSTNLKLHGESHEKLHKKKHGVPVKDLRIETTPGDNSHKLLDPHQESPQDLSPALTPLALRRQRTAEIEANRPMPSEQSLQLARDTWSSLSKNRDGLGTNLFIRMFESYPDLKSAFGPFKHLTQNDSDYEEVLRSHGVRVVSIVELVLSKSPDNEDVIENLHELGRKHLSFNAKVEYIDIVSQMFLFAIESAMKEQWDNRTEQSWGEIIRFITYIMRETMFL